MFRAAFFTLLFSLSLAVDVPDSPATVTVERYSDSQLRVSLSAPESDNGAEITSCTVEYDTEPGVRQIQAIKTDVDLGPNEIKTITTSADDVREVKVINTRATDVDEVQTITTYANPGETLSGTFTVTFDTTANGGSSETSSPISFDADPDSSSMTSMKSILEAMKNIDSVNVTRSSFGVEENIFDAYVWSITFTGIGNEGNVPQLRLATSNLVATGESWLLRHASVDMVLRATHHKFFFSAFIQVLGLTLKQRLREMKLVVVSSCL